MADDLKNRKEALQSEYDISQELLKGLKTYKILTKDALTLRNSLTTSLMEQKSVSEKLEDVDTAIGTLLMEQVVSGKEVNKELLLKLNLTKGYLEQSVELAKAEDIQQSYLDERNAGLKNILGITSDIEDAVLNGTFKALAMNKAFENIGENASRMGDSIQSSVKDLGLSGFAAMQLQGNIESARFSMTGLLYGSEAVEASGKAIAEKYGSASMATSDLIEGVTQLSSLGLDAAEATDLASVFKSAGVEATEVKGIISDIASKEGISAKKAMEGMDGQMSQLVGKSKQQLETIIKSNAQLIKQGTNLKQIESISNNMLDIEGSMKAQAKARVMLGRDMNVNAVRSASLALQSARTDEDRADARKRISAEILKGVGGMAEYAQMTMKEKDASAAAYGMSTDELTTMMEKKKIADEMTASYGEQAGFMTAMIGIGKQGLSLAADTAIEMAKMAAKMVVMNLMQGKGTGIGNLNPFKKKSGDGGSIETEVPGADEVGSTESGGGLKSLAEGLKAMGDGKVFAGIGAVALAGPAFIIALPSIPFLLFMGKVKLKEIQSNFEGLAAGLNSMSSTFMGSLAMAVAGPALAVATLAIPFLLFMGKVKLKTLGSNFLELGIGLQMMSSTFVGSLALAAFGVAALIAIPSLIFLAGVALLGAAGGAGLSALGVGLAAFGATAPLAIIGIGLIAALGLAMIPFAVALLIVTPAIEAFGNIIIGVLGAIPPIIAAVADGFVTMFSALTPEAILGMLALGPALMLAGVGMVAFAVGMAAASAIGFFGGGIMDDIGALSLMAPGLSITAQALGDITTNMGGLGSALQNIDSMIDPLLRLSSVTGDLASGLYAVAGGLAAFSFAGLLASPVIAGLSMLGAVAPALESLGEFFGMGGNSDESTSTDKSAGGSSSSALLEELKGLRSDIQSQPILINVDGKVVSRITRVQRQQASSK